MKRIIKCIITIIISVGIINTTNAGTIEKKLYKQVSITSKQVEKDYSKSMTNKIRDLFLMYRYTKNTVFLNKLEFALKKSIQRMNKQSYLTIKKKRKLNLYNNIYYRTKLLLDYNLK